MGRILIVRDNPCRADTTRAGRAGHTKLGRSPTPPFPTQQSTWQHVANMTNLDMFGPVTAMCPPFSTAMSLEYCE